jgi:hypothetical protein
MGRLHSAGNWLIRVQGNEHPPVHVIHPDGKAVVHLDGTVLNRGVPTAVIAQAVAWVTGHAAAIRAEWDRMNNPPTR